LMNIFLQNFSLIILVFLFYEASVTSFCAEFLSYKKE
jgi:hypothetical protein